MSVGVTYPNFSALCQHAREHSFVVGLTVAGGKPSGGPGKEYRELDSLVIHPAAQPKGKPIVRASVTFATLDAVAAELLGRLS